MLLYSELPAREDCTIIESAKNSLYAGYLDFILLFKEDKPGKIADKLHFVDALDAVYCLDSIGDMILVKYLPEEKEFAKLLDSRLGEKTQFFNEGDTVPEIILDNDREIAVYVLVTPGIPTED